MTSVLPDISIEWGNLGIDTSQAISGRIVMPIIVKKDLSHIPPRSLTFYVENVSGDILYRTKMKVTADTMKVGFRTSHVKNGQYSFYFNADVPDGKGIKVISTEAKKFIIKN